MDEDKNRVVDYWQVDSELYSQNNGLQYVDNDLDGINDFVQVTVHEGHNHDFNDIDDDGIYDLAQDGSITWHGPGFVDEDGDGICDLWQQKRTRQGQEQGSGDQGHGSGENKPNKPQDQGFDSETKSSK